MHTIKKVADLAGVSLKTLRHYDKIGLLVPSARGENNYRLYNDNDLERLQQIMFYKELGFSLDEIKCMLSSKNFDVEKSLEQQIKMLKTKAVRIEKIITLAERTLKNFKGECKMTEKERFEAFKDKMIADNDQQFGVEVVEKYGADLYKASNKKLKAMTSTQYKELEQLTQDVNDAFITAQKTKDPKSEDARHAVELHKRWISYYWAEFNKDAYIAVANNYVDDHRFAAYYNKLGENMAVFVRDSILAYFEQ